MGKVRLPFASYNLWSLFTSPVGKECWFCDMKRGFNKVRQKEPKVKALLEQDNKHQRIGILAQKGVYAFHQDLKLLHQSDCVEIAEVLRLNQELDEVRERVIFILTNYKKNPILVEKNIVRLSRGDEGFPTPITIQQGSYRFNLYASTDCIFSYPDGTIHILDFKTGKSDFDRRQAYVYLLAASYMYPQQAAVASFYNLETGLTSDIITTTPEQLQFVQIELQDIAKQHELEKKRYWENPDDFARIFPPNPGTSCNYCIFSSICKFSVCEVLR